MKALLIALYLFSASLSFASQPQPRPPTSDREENTWTGVFTGPEFTGVMSQMELDVGGYLRGKWITNQAREAIDVMGTYGISETNLVFSFNSVMTISSGISTPIVITGGGVLGTASASGEWSLKSTNPSVKPITGEWHMVKKYFDKAALTIERRPSEVAPSTPSPSSYHKAFLPGLSGSVLYSVGTGQIYPGASFHYDLVQGADPTSRSDDFGGYYELYMEIGFYKERDSTFSGDIFFTYVAGINLSFEKLGGTFRDFLIPYFGVKSGGVYFNNQSAGILAEPILGIVLYQNENININIDTGLFLNSVNLSDYLGFHSSLTINFAF